MAPFLLHHLLDEANALLATRTTPEDGTPIVARQSTTTVTVLPVADGNSSGASNLSGGSIAGIVIGSILGVLLIIWIIKWAMGTQNNNAAIENDRKRERGYYYDREPRRSHQHSRSRSRRRSADLRVHEPAAVYVRDSRSPGRRPSRGEYDNGARRYSRSPGAVVYQPPQYEARRSRDYQ